MLSCVVRRAAARSGAMTRVCGCGAKTWASKYDELPLDVYTRLIDVTLDGVQVSASIGLLSKRFQHHACRTTRRRRSTTLTPRTRTLASTSKMLTACSRLSWAPITDLC